VHTSWKMASWDEVRLNKLRIFCQSKEISESSIVKLRQLEDFDIVCLCDDSGSMSTAVQDQGPNRDPFAVKKTRWDELCLTVQTIAEVATALDKDGIDIFFLNRPGMKCIFSNDQIKGLFVTPPAGYTPTVAALQNVLVEKAQSLTERKVLLILLTDGQPTDLSGQVQIQDFVLSIRQKPSNLYVSIVACTDDESVLTYLDQLDNNVPFVDVSDDFYNERKQVLAKSGLSLSYGDYICKILLGPIDPSFDQLDESTKPQQKSPANQSSPCCAIC